MEEEARGNGFPIIGRLVGATVEVLARSAGARRVFELGSGYGYSAYWFARAVGAGGEVHRTDGDPENEAKALGYLRRAGLDGPIRWHVGDAIRHLNAAEGEFDVVYDDIDKDGYPEAWLAARERIRVGGLYLCDTVRGMAASRREAEPARADTRVILEHNALIADDERYLHTIVPTRDGLMVALRVS